MSERITNCFETLKAEGKTAFIPFIMSGDPDMAQCQQLLNQLPAAGADIIELGMPFSDPMADGPIIEAAGLRALRAGMSLKKVLQMVQSFRETDQTTPLILMGYYNPVYHYGIEKFAQHATAAGVDGLILVDVPPEEEAECAPLFEQNGLDFIRLIAPTTSTDRQAYVTEHASGFVYCIAVKGVTGSQSAGVAELSGAVGRLRQQTALPVAIGFGIRTPQQAAEIAPLADAVVVGSAIVAKLQDDGLQPTLDYISDMSAAVHKSHN